MRNLYESVTSSVEAIFINALLSSENKKINFASSPVGMTDKIISENLSVVNKQSWVVEEKQAIPLSELIESNSILNELKNQNILKVLKIDVEGAAKEVLLGVGKYINHFDFIICEFLPEERNQYTAMEFLDSIGYRLIDLERAFKPSKKFERSLLIMDTIWVNKTYHKDLESEMDYLESITKLKKIKSFIGFFIIRSINKIINRKLFINISDSELFW